VSPAAKLVAPGRATVRAPLAPMYDRASANAVQTSQRLAGFELDLLRNEGDWFLARGTDGFEGWMHRSFISPAPASGARRSSQIIRVSLGCVTRSAAGDRRALPLGARLSPDEIVRSGEFVEQPQLPVKFPRAALAITRSAKEYFEGTPYMWGGITPWGADCSGFVQTVFGMHGVALPRNASQQAETGDEVESIEKTEAGDLAFFSDSGDGVVTHVGMMLGEGRVAHCSIGRAGFYIEKLSDRKDPYVKQLAERFVKAKRVL
jgi:hypothetical protein